MLHEAVALRRSEAASDLVGDISACIQLAAFSNETQHPHCVLVLKVVMGVRHLAVALGAEERESNTAKRPTPERLT